MKNLEIYEKATQVPEDAKKPITGGKLKGFTNINPQYRIKRLTEIFGPVGVGWWVTPVKLNEVEQPYYDYQVLSDNLVLCHCSLALHFVVDGQESRPVIGNGSSLVFSSDKKALNDEHRKMAWTDAFGVACKQLGIGGDVYWKQDISKYDIPVYPEQQYQTYSPDMYAQNNVSFGQQVSAYTGQQAQNLAPQTAYVPPQYQPQAQYPVNAQIAPTEPQQPVQVTTFNSLEEARAVIITYGRDRGKSIGQVADQPKGGESLSLLAKSSNTPEGQAAIMILNSRVM